MEPPICMFYEVILDEILMVEDYGLLWCAEDLSDSNLMVEEYGAFVSPKTQLNGLMVSSDVLECDCFRFMSALFSEVPMVYINWLLAHEGQMWSNLGNLCIQTRSMAQLQT